jgi:hypothetical protein
MKKEYGSVYVPEQTTVSSSKWVEESVENNNKTA